MLLWLLLTSAWARAAPRDTVSSASRLRARQINVEGLAAEMVYELQPYKPHEMCTALIDDLNFDDERKMSLRAAVFTLDDDETNDPYTSNWELDKACADAFRGVKQNLIGSSDSLSLFDFVDRVAKCEVDAEGHTLVQAILKNGFNLCASTPLVQQVLLAPVADYHPLLAKTRDGDNILHLVVQSNSEVLLTKAMKMITSYPFKGKKNSKDFTGTVVLYSMATATNDDGETPLQLAERSGNLARKLKQQFKTMKMNFQTSINEHLKETGLPTSSSLQ